MQEIETDPRNEFLGFLNIFVELADYNSEGTGSCLGANTG